MNLIDDRMIEDLSCEIVNTKTSNSSNSGSPETLAMFSKMSTKQNYMTAITGNILSLITQSNSTEEDSSPHSSRLLFYNFFN